MVRMKWVSGKDCCIVGAFCLLLVGLFPSSLKGAPVPRALPRKEVKWDDFLRLLPRGLRRGRLAWKLSVGCILATGWGCFMMLSSFSPLMMNRSKSTRGHFRIFL